jgi:N-acetylmuramoyl-L-alanine amidase
MYPSYTIALDTGRKIELSCVAPAGATVWASVGGQQLQLTQAAAALSGVPAKFKGTIILPEVSGVRSIGKVTYSMEWNGSKSLQSNGELFVVGAGAQLLVQVQNVSSMIFGDATTTSHYLTTSKKGAVDYVTGQKGNRYQLGMGGWINMDTVLPLLEAATSKNQVSSVEFRQAEGGEEYVFHGTSNPIATAEQTTGGVRITLPHTSGVSELPTGRSRIFSGAAVSQSGSDTVLDLTLATGKTLWGWTITYQDGDTILFCKYKPTLSGDSAKPLAGVTIALDPGHGGTDTGAFGCSSLPARWKRTSPTTRPLLPKSGWNRWARPCSLPARTTAIEAWMSAWNRRSKKGPTFIFRCTAMPPRWAQTDKSPMELKSIIPSPPPRALRRRAEPNAGRHRQGFAQGASFLLPGDPQLLRAVGARGDGLPHQSGRI